MNHCELNDGSGSHYNPPKYKHSHVHTFSGNQVNGFDGVCKSKQFLIAALSFEGEVDRATFTNPDFVTLRFNLTNKVK